MTDTQALVAAVGIGKGLLKMAMPPMGGGPGQVMLPPGGIRPSSMMSSVSPQGVGHLGKSPSSVKTNIKAANQIHPFR